MSVSVFSTIFFPETFLILRRTRRDIIVHVHRLSCKVPVIVVRFERNLIFTTQFRKILKYQMSEKSVHWESSFSMRTDGRTGRQQDMTRPIVAILRTRLTSVSECYHGRLKTIAQILVDSI
jgi:hypothetical protein